MGTLGTQEMIVIFVLALLVFGPKKLPELGKTVAKALGEFRRASTELKATFDREMSTLEREHESIKEVARDYHDQVYNYDDSSYYDYGVHDSGTSDSTATPSTTVSASATQGAEQPALEAPHTEPATHPAPKPPEGTVAHSDGTPEAPHSVAS